MLVKGIMILIFVGGMLNLNLATIILEVGHFIEGCVTKFDLVLFIGRKFGWGDLACKHSNRYYKKFKSR